MAGIVAAAGIINMILGSQGIKSDLLDAIEYLDPITGLIKGISSEKQRIAEKELRDQINCANASVRDLYIEGRRAKAQELADAIRVIERETFQAKLGLRRIKGKQSENILTKTIANQIYSVTPKTQPITQLSKPTDINSRLLSLEARSQEMRDDNLARSSEIKARQLEIESQKKLASERRSILSSESSAIQNLMKIQQGQLSDIEKQKKESEQAVIQNEIQQRLKNITPTVSTRALPPSVSIRALPPSVSIRGRGNELLIKVMNEFGMTKAEAQKYIKKYGAE